jgi:dienelactone hydrolase
LVAVKKAASLKHQGEYDAVYCVADVEGPAQRGEVDKALTLARRNGITLILSNPCFEVWVLAHFGRTSRSFADAGAVVAAVRQHTPDYRKNDEAIYKRLKDYTTAAIANARAVRQTDHDDRPVQDCNSCTEVGKLVSYLLTPAH